MLSFNLKFRKILFLHVALLAAVLLLSSCDKAKEIDTAVEMGEREAERAIATISPDTINDRQVFKVDNTPWLGGQAIPTKNGSQLPSYLTQPDSIVLTFSGQEALPQVARMIESLTNVPVKVSNTVYADALSDVSDRMFQPAGGVEVAAGKIIWSGPLNRLLDQLSETYATDWSFDGQSIVLSSEKTKIFTLHALSNTLTLSGSADASAGSGGSIPQINISDSATLEIWGEIQEAIEGMIGSQGNVTFSPSTGTITATARRDILDRVENYLKYQNEKRLRRIAISVKVLSVTTDDSQTLGMDTTSVIRDAIGRSLGLRTVTDLGDGASGLGVTIFKSATRLNDDGDPEVDPNLLRGDVKSNIEASNRIQRAKIVHSGTLVTLSDQPAPLQVGRQRAYLERVSSSDTGVSLEPGTLDLGLFMTILPRIVADDRVLVRLSLAISSLEELREFGTDEEQIQLPEIETTGFLQNAVMRNGETMVLAGFERGEDSMDENGTPGSFLLGGTQNTQNSRQLLVLIINSQILPEEPVSVASF